MVSAHAGSVNIVSGFFFFIYLSPGNQHNGGCPAGTPFTGAIPLWALLAAINLFDQDEESREGKVGVRRRQFFFFFLLVEIAVAGMEGLVVSGFTPAALRLALPRPGFLFFLFFIFYSFAGPIQI